MSSAEYRGDNDFDGCFASSQFVPNRSDNQKNVFDPIWGYSILLEPKLVKIIDTPYFQRLRDLKQLGACYLVFPGASHNRFEHSIGTSHLAGQMLRNIKARQPELGITERDVLLVKIAALCHDLGHGPFSHVFDGEFIPAVRPDIHWHHEQASEMMLDAALADSGITDPEQEEDPITPEEVKFIKALINPRPDTDRGEKPFLFDIVSNSRNSVDVDKFDYIARDCYMTGVRSSHDSRRLLTNCKVLDNQICFHAKDVYSLYELFHTRYSLFKQVYSHRVVKAVEYMICDILKLADPVLKISEAIFDPERYLHLTDAILKSIEANTDPKLEEARALCYKLRKRQLYRLAYEVLLSEHAPEQKITPKDVMRYAPSGGRLREEHIIIHNLTLNYAKKDSNPVEHIKFFKSWDSSEAFTIPQAKVSLLIPTRFSERYVRVFVRTHDDAELIEEAHRAASELIEREMKTKVDPHISNPKSPQRTRSMRISPSGSFQHVGSSKDLNKAFGATQSQGASQSIMTNDQNDTEKLSDTEVDEIGEEPETKIDPTVRKRGVSFSLSQQTIPYRSEVVRSASYSSAQGDGANASSELALKRSRDDLTNTASTSGLSASQSFSQSTLSMSQDVPGQKKVKKVQGTLSNFVQRK